MDGVVIWIYAIFWLLSVKIKIWRKLISLTNFNATSSTIIKRLSLHLLSTVEAFKWNHLSLLWNAFSNTPSYANIRKPSRSVTKLSHLKARNSAHQKLHHDRGVDTKNVSANHLRYKSNHLWWKYNVKKI